MEYTTEQAKNVLERLWYLWGMNLLDRICAEFNLSPEYKDVLVRKYLRPNDWQVHIRPEAPQ
jgi:hypothetical protein